jgi:hypothetical protein
MSQFDDIALIARNDARLNRQRRRGTISRRQWYALVAAALGEFR